MKEHGIGSMGDFGKFEVDSHSYSDESDKPIKKVKKSPDEGKKEKNIKRRVYDALNVQLAAGVLHKKGKDIMPNQNSALFQRVERELNLNELVSKKEPSSNLSKTISELEEKR